MFHTREPSSAAAVALSGDLASLHVVQSTVNLAFARQGGRCADKGSVWQEEITYQIGPYLSVLYLVKIMILVIDRDVI